MRTLLSKGLVATFPLLWAAGLWAAETSEEDQLALVYGDESFVSIATGARQPVARAPAVATVITAQDISAMGAADLDDALESVPGLHASRLLTYAGKPIFIIRGIHSAFNPQVLVLLNGLPLTSVFLGDRGDVWGGMPLGGMVDVSDTTPYLAPHQRQIRYAYLQDEWQLAPDWTLTAGVRHDRYSDFGHTTNRRVALVWAAAYNVTAKLLYGRAFRAPSFTELYTINNPVALGNPSVTPETIASLEAAVSWQPTSRVQAGLSLFRHRMRDILRQVPNADPTTGSTAQNAGSQTGRGFEIEAAWDADAHWRIGGNYAFQHSTDDATQQDAGLAPRHHLNLRVDWRIAPARAIGAQLNWVGGRRREPGDNRPPVADYRTLDLDLRYTLPAGWGLSAGIRNLFGADAREPSQAPGLLPHDMPLPRRTWMLQAVHVL